MTEFREIPERSWERVFEGEFLNGTSNPLNRIYPLRSSTLGDFFLMVQQNGCMSASPRLYYFNGQDEILLPEGQDSIPKQELKDELPMSIIALNITKKDLDQYLWALRFPSGAILEQRFKLGEHVYWGKDSIGTVLRPDINLMDPWGNFRSIGTYDIVWAVAVANTDFALREIEVTFGGYYKS